MQYIPWHDALATTFEFATGWLLIEETERGAEFCEMINKVERKMNRSEFNNTDKWLRCSAENETLYPFAVGRPNVSAFRGFHAVE